MWKRVPRGGEIAVLDRGAGNRPHWEGENWTDSSNSGGIFSSFQSAGSTHYPL